MHNSFLKLYIEINKINFIFFVVKSDDQENFRVIYELHVPLEGIEDNRIIDSKKFFNTIKDNIYLIEQKCNHTFKELILILDNFNPTFINLTGFKKLNGSQILRENITYILNTLKSYVDNSEPKKTIIHIFNSSFNLDNKKIDNLPIGLFGDFYSHELSFILISINDFKNLKSILEKCNLKVKKILNKSFIKGAFLNDTNKQDETFFEIMIKTNNSKIFYFENNSLKFEQDFKFGTDIIIKDISKITSLKNDMVKKILNELSFNYEISDEELLDQEFFKDGVYRKIKKKLIYEIALARITELAELIIFKNVNLSHYTGLSKVIFLECDLKLQPKSLKDIFEIAFKKKGFHIKFWNNFSSHEMLKTANKLVHFGWKKEAIPVTDPKKSIIARFFDALFD
tara:strand:- start:1540 stop:2733 length:1194 start_codon:yes stop_codon:yes gene_type:complete